MLGIRTLVDIGFFLSIIGFVVYPFVNEAVRQDLDRDQPPEQNRPRSEETFETDLLDPDRNQTSQESSFELPTLTIDATGRTVRGLYLDDTPVTGSALAEVVRERGVKRLRLKAHPDAANQIIMDAKRLCAQGGVMSFADIRDPTNPVLIK